MDISLFLMNFWWISLYLSYHMSFSFFLQFHANIKKFRRLAPFTTLYCALLCEELEFFTSVGKYQHIFVQGGGGEFGTFGKNIYPWRLPTSQCHSLQFCNILSEKIFILRRAPIGGKGGVLPCSNFLSKFCALFPWNHDSNIAICNNLESMIFTIFPTAPAMMVPLKIL